MKRTFRVWIELQLACPESTNLINNNTDGIDTM